MSDGRPCCPRSCCPRRGSDVRVRALLACSPSAGLTALCCAVARIALVKPDKAKAVENLIIQLAQRGQLQERVRWRLCASALTGVSLRGAEVECRCRRTG